MDAFSAGSDIENHVVTDGYKLRGGIRTEHSESESVPACDVTVIHDRGWGKRSQVSQRAEAVPQRQAASSEMAAARKSRQVQLNVSALAHF